MLIKLRKAQSTAEYAILLSLVVAAAVAMQHEIRRTLQARMHDGADYLVAETAEIGTTDEYEVYAEGGRFSFKDRTSSADQTIQEHRDSEAGDDWMERDRNTGTDFTIGTQQ